MSAIKWKTTIKKLERKMQLIRCWKKIPGDPNSETVSVTADLGWAILLDGSLEWLFIGNEEPPKDFQVGKQVEVSITPLD
jgi:hypothetical protein